MISQILPVALLLLVAAASPGPNTVVVVRTASRVGFTAALPSVAGMVLGCLAMFLLVIAGADAIVSDHPAILRWIGVAGAAYLVWLGANMVNLRDHPSEDTDDSLPDAAGAPVPALRLPGQHPGQEGPRNDRASPAAGCPEAAGARAAG